MTKGQQFCGDFDSISKSLSKQNKLFTNLLSHALNPLFSTWSREVFFAFCYATVSTGSKKSEINFKIKHCLTDWDFVVRQNLYAIMIQLFE